MRRFYGAPGRQKREGGSENLDQFEMGGARLALYPLDLLTAEAAPTAAAPAATWNGVTLAVNVSSPASVDAAYRTATAAGAVAVAAPVEREWGGYSAYVSDPEGQRWPAPGPEIDDEPAPEDEAGR